MNATVEDLRPTIVPKSDQLNAEQLLGGPMTVTVSSVTVSDSAEQPVIVHYHGENGRPYKPCKTCRKVLIHAWGPDGRAWVGKSMTLYNDTTVKFGGDDVGGIRISHMSDIDANMKVSLTSTRGKKAKYEIKRMARPQDSGAQAVDHDAAIADAASVEELKRVFKAAWRAAGTDTALQTRRKAAYDARLAELDAPPTPAAKTLAQFKAEISAATGAETAALVLDSSRDVLDATDQAALADHYRNRWEDA